MRAFAEIVAARRGDRTEIVGRRADAPLAVRRCGDRVLVASTAATPVGGDELHLDVRVEQGARLDVGSVAATVVWPSPDGASSSMTTTASVADGAELVLAVEPTISVIGSCHRVATTVVLAPTARCRIVEELALGRTDERAGDVAFSLRVERDGTPLVHHAESFGPHAPGAGSSVSIGGARFVVSMLIVGPPAGPAHAIVEPDRAAARLPLADDAVLVLAVGADRETTWSAIRMVAPGSATDDPLW